MASGSVNNGGLFADIRKVNRRGVAFDNDALQ